MKQLIKDHIGSILLTILALILIPIAIKTSETTTKIKADTVQLINKEIIIDLSELKKVGKGGTLKIITNGSDEFPNAPDTLHYVYID